MPLVRLILAGLVAIAAVAVVVFTGVVVLLTGLVGFVMQLFGRRPDPGRSPGAPNRVVPRPTDDVIDVESTKVPDEPAAR